MNINNSFPSKWLKSGDVPEDQDLILTMKKVEHELIGQGEEAENKPVLHFIDSDKGMVLNVTNAKTITKLYGPETDDWKGKQIAIFATEVDFAGKQTLALRIRMKAPGQAKAKTSPPPAPVDDLSTDDDNIPFDGGGQNYSDLVTVQAMKKRAVPEGTLWMFQSEKGTWYQTLDNKFAAIAKAAGSDKKQLNITFHGDSSGNNVLESIQMVMD